MVIKALLPTDEELSPSYDEARGEQPRDPQQDRHAGLVNMRAALQAQLAQQLAQQQLAQQQAALATAIAAAAAHHHHQNNNVIGKCSTHCQASKFGFLNSE